MLKQLTKDKNIVNLCTRDNLDTKMWKYQNRKVISRELERLKKIEGMKKYLTAKEMNDLLYVNHLMEMNHKMSNEWLERGNLLEEEHNFLNMAISYVERYIQSVLSRMPVKEIDKFMKRAIRSKGEPIRIVDKWMEDRVFGTYETEFKIAKIERPQLEKLAWVGISNVCKDCTMSYCKCEFYDILEDNLIPRCEAKDNCPYAFISDEKRKEQELKELLKKEKKANKSKRSQKKKKNRFDEDDEIEYVYNFTPKGVK